MGESAQELVEALHACDEDDTDGFVAVLGKFGEIVYRDHVAETVSALVQNAQLAHHNDGDGEGAGRILRAYAQLIRTGFAKGSHHWTVVATALAIAQLAGNDSVAEIIVGELVYEPIEHPSVAFNVACYFAVKGRREEVMRCARRAIELGKSKEQFLAESDFAAYHDDPEFKALVS